MFSRVLIANRGEIAVRVQRTLHRLGLESAVVYHALDRNSTAVSNAHQVVELTGDTPVSAYLDIDQIVSACEQTGADAVHPGYGFLAENPAFASRLASRGIAFVGPDAPVIELMGNKVAARSFCIDHGFPIMPSVVADGDPEGFIDAVRKLQMPCVIKAAAGGGGKGMHIVRNPEELGAAIALARAEAARSFGDATVYAECYVERARHIEVQILADHHGQVVHLGERECSVQRRFQKVIEETPAPNLSGEIRDRICTTAVAIAEAVGYRNAGTVEFILTPQGEFYFLEMNTRIQVEHAVTEAVTGLDLVEHQLRVAAGEPLGPELAQIRPDGHALEARLYAENPADDHAPCVGRLLRYRLSPAVRVDDGYTERADVTTAFDPMLAKLISHAPSREAAIAAMHEALSESTVLGVTTNLDYLDRIIAHPAFRAGDLHTGFLTEHAAELDRGRQAEPAELEVLLTAAALASREMADEALSAPAIHRAIGGWRN